MTPEDSHTISQDLQAQDNPIGLVRRRSSTDASDHRSKLLDKLRPSFRYLLLHLASAILLIFRILTSLVVHLLLKLVKRSTLVVSWSRMCSLVDDLAKTTLRFFDAGSGQRLERRYENVKTKLKASSKTLQALWSLAQFIANNPEVLVSQLPSTCQGEHGCMPSHSIPSLTASPEPETILNSPGSESPSQNIKVTSRERLNHLITEFRANQQASFSSESRLFRCVSDNQLGRKMTWSRNSSLSFPVAGIVKNMEHTELDRHEQHQELESMFSVQDSEIDSMPGRSSQSMIRGSILDTSIPVRSSSITQFKPKAAQMNEKRPTVRAHRCSVYERRCRDPSTSPVENRSIGHFKSSIPIAERRPAMKKTIEGAALKPFRLQRASR